MPAEWHPHEATWLSWPTNKDTWPVLLEQVEETFLKVISELVKGEDVYLLTDSEEEKDRVTILLEKRHINMGRIRFYVSPTVDVWIRDYGPNFVLNDQGELGYNRWHFNAWGNKYEDLAEDDKVLDRLKNDLPANRFEPGIILEGGSIEVNGTGIVMTTRQCLLNKNRNPHLSSEELEGYLKKYLGVKEVWWLDDGLEGDDTDGHIDDFARFVAEDTVLIAAADEGDEENAGKLSHNYAILERYAEAKGIKVVRMPMPKPVVYEGQQLPASYMNFYIANKAVLVPIFSDEHDLEALSILKNCFTDREVVGVDCRILIRGFGAIHCASQQQPQVLRRGEE